MNAHSKHSAQATISLYSMRGKSWSYYQKHVSSLIDIDHDSTNILPPRTTADVQRLDLQDCNLYGVSPSNPGPMVLCDQCNHVIAPEGIMRHVKRVHGSKIVPAPSNKLRIPSKGSSTAGSTQSNANTQYISRITNNSLSTPQAADATLSTEFTNRLNVSKMAPPTPLNAAAEIANVGNNSSSNSNSPISLSKISTSTSGSGSSSKRNRKVLPVKDREYDPEKHCGVRIGNMKPCTRSLTCKTHQISLRRNVEGRSKPFDQLLADHRNNAKESHKHSSNKTTHLAGDNGNQLLESIGDSNSSSSFDMERRSFSSNSNQSTIGNYNSDQSTAFSTSSQQLNGTQTLPSVLSSITSAVAGSNVSAPNFTYSDVNSHRKPSNVLPFTPSPDDRSNNASQIGDLYNSSTLSAMQTTSSNPQPNHFTNSGLNTSAALSSLGDYTMNDLINDDNGDGLDMNFWENFDNFNYDSDLVMSNNNGSNSQQYPQSHSKSNIKRTHDGSELERKRKRVNELKENMNQSRNSPKDNTKGMCASPSSHDSSQTLLKPNLKLAQNKKSSLSAVPHNILIDSTSSEVICIDEDEDDAANNNIDATINRNSDKENGTIYPVTPTKELGNDISIKHHSNRGHQRMDSTTVNGTQSPITIEKPLTQMTLSNEPVNSTDLMNVTKILSEADHQSLTQALAAQVSVSISQHPNDANETNDASKQPSGQSITSVPIGENESFLLDMVYKCLRGKGVRMINSNYSSSNSSNTNRSSANDSSRNREKENAIDNHWSDDEIPTIPVNATNNLALPATQRFSSSKCAYVPRAIASNQFNMGRGRGTCHVKHQVDITKKVQQQIFQRIQTQQQNGTFANNMIALRNNGSVMRLNASLTPSAVAITNAINALANNTYTSNAVKTTVTNITTANTNSSSVNNATNINATANMGVGVSPSASPNTANPKLTAFKKPVHFVNSIATTTNGPIVLLNPTGAGAMSSAVGNQRVTILRRPMNQSIQLIARPAIDPTNSYAVMPVIHRVRTRTLKPNLPKILETDRLLESLKSIIRPQNINRDYDTTKKVLSVYQSLVKAANHTNHHINTNSSSSSKRKSHSSLSNHKSNSGMSTSSTQKPNGQSHGNSNGGIVTSGTNYMSSTNSINNHTEKRTHIRIDVNHK